MAKDAAMSGGRLEANQAAIDSPQPEDAGTVLTDSADLQIAGAAGCGGAEADVAVEVIALGLVAAQATARSHPDLTRAICIECQHGVRGQGTRITLAVSEMTRNTRPRVEYVETLVERAGPDAPVRIN